MVEQITIGKKSAEMVADFILQHGHEWARFYDARINKARVFDMRYRPSEEAIRAWHEVISLLSEEDEPHEGTHSRQQQSSD